MEIENLERIISLLEKEHGKGPWNWHTTLNPFQVLISTVLSQRTRDSRTDQAARQLFERFPDPESLSKAELSEIERLIKPANYYITKARKVKEIARIVCQDFDGKTPDSLDELCKLPGVGKKTASCTMLYGHGISHIPVDIHVQIISQRLSWTRERDPDNIQIDLEKRIPKRFWPVINELMVKHGQKICFTRNPRCFSCPIVRYCKYPDKRLRV